MPFRKKTLVLGGLGGLVLLFVALTVMALVLIPGKVKEKLVRAGFAEDLSVSMHLTRGVTIQGLKAKRGIKGGEWALSMDTGEVSIPMSLREILFQTGLQGGKIRVSGTVLNLTQKAGQAEAESGGETNSGSGRKRVMRALKQLCPKGCEVGLEGIELRLKLEDFKKEKSIYLVGVARLQANGSVQVLVQHERGASLRASFDLNRPRQSMEVLLRHVEGMVLDDAFLKPLLPVKPELPLEQVDFSFDELQREPGGTLRVSGLKLRGEVGEDSSFDSEIGKVIFNKDEKVWCQGLPLCPSEASDLSLNLRMSGERNLSLGASQVFSCGDNCLRAMSATARVDTATKRGHALFADVEGHWMKELRTPDLWKLHTGRVRVMKKKVAPTITPSPDEMASKDEEEPSFSRDLYRRLLRYDGHFGALLDLPGRFIGVNERLGGIAPRVEFKELVLELGAQGESGPEAEVSKLVMTAVDDGQVLFEGRGELRAPVANQGELPELPEKRLQKDKLDKMTGDGTPTVEPSLTVTGPVSIEGTVLVGHDGKLEAAYSGQSPAWVLVHPKVAIDPLIVHPIEFSGSLHRSVAKDRTTWMVPSMELKATAGGVGSIQLGLDLDAHPKRRGWSMAIDIPEQYCSRIHRSIPRSLIPRLRGTRFKGKGALRIEAGMRFSATRTLRLEFFPELEQCIPTRTGAAFPLRNLTDDSVTFQIVDPRMPEPVIVGPGTGDFVALRELPDFVWGSALATEDLEFWNHHGFVPNLIRRAIIVNLDKQRYVYGGSTITQQLVKNLFLTREKTLSRKLEEAVLVWLIERTVEKERIIELYLNCVEFGPNVYGIRHAAEVYFGVPPAELTPIEAGWIMAIKPNPTRGYFAWKSRRITPSMKKRLGTVRKRLLDRDWIAEEDALEMDPDRLYDRPADVRAYEIPEEWEKNPGQAPKP